LRRAGRDADPDLGDHGPRRVPRRLRLAGQRARLPDQIVARHGRASLRDNRTRGAEGRVPQERRVRRAAGGAQRRLHHQPRAGTLTAEGPSANETPRMTRTGHFTLIVLLIAAAIAPWPARADGADAAPPAAAPSAGAADVARMQAELSRLKQEVRDQRQLILQLM